MVIVQEPQTIHRDLVNKRSHSLMDEVEAKLVEAVPDNSH